MKKEPHLSRGPQAGTISNAALSASMRLTSSRFGRCSRWTETPGGAGNVGPAAFRHICRCIRVNLRERCGSFLTASYVLMYNLTLEGAKFTKLDKK